MVPICFLVGVFIHMSPTHHTYVGSKPKLLPDSRDPKWKGTELGASRPRHPTSEGAVRGESLFFHSSVLLKGLLRFKNLITNFISSVVQMALETDPVFIHTHGHQGKKSKRKFTVRLIRHGTSLN